MGHAIFAALMALLGFFGLALASGAEDLGFKLFAWMLVAFGIIMVFTTVNQMTNSKSATED